MSDKTRKAIAARIKRLAELRAPKETAKAIKDKDLSVTVPVTHNVTVTSRAVEKE